MLAIPTGRAGRKWSHSGRAGSHPGDSRQVEAALPPAAYSRPAPGPAYWRSAPSQRPLMHFAPLPPSPPPRARCASWLVHVCSGEYSIKDGVPVNPAGPTGMEGRGSLFRWGPNHTAQILLTRWARLRGTEEIYRCDGKPVLEALLATEQVAFDAKAAFPAGDVALSAAESHDKLHATLRQVARDHVEGHVAQSMLAFRVQEQLDQDLHAGRCRAVFGGVAEDDRNTDNAWVECAVGSYHSSGVAFHGFPLKFQLPRAIGAGGGHCRWRAVYSSMPGVSGRAAEWLKQAAIRHEAYYKSSSPGSYQSMEAPSKQAAQGPTASSAAAAEENEEEFAEDGFSGMDVADRRASWARKMGGASAPPAAAGPAPQSTAAAAPTQQPGKRTSISLDGFKGAASTTVDQESYDGFSALEIPSPKAAPAVSIAEEGDGSVAVQMRRRSHSTAGAGQRRSIAGDTPSDSTPTWVLEAAERRRRRQERQNSIDGEEAFQLAASSSPAAATSQPGQTPPAASTTATAKPARSNSAEMRPRSKTLDHPPASRPRGDDIPEWKRALLAKKQAGKPEPKQVGTTPRAARSALLDDAAAIATPLVEPALTQPLLPVGRLSRTAVPLLCCSGALPPRHALVSPRAQALTVQDQQPRRQSRASEALASRLRLFEQGGQ